MVQIWARHDEQTVSFQIGDSAVIGRQPDCSVVLADPTVSRQHARLERTPDGYVVIDLDSSLGTFVDDRRVLRAPFRPGSVLRVGDTTLALGIGEEPKVTAHTTRLVSVKADQRFLDAKLIDRETMSRDYERLRAMHAVSQAIGVEQDLEKILEVVVVSVLEILPADRAAIVFLGGHIQKSRSRRGNAQNVEIPRAIIDRVVESKAALISGDAGRDERLARSTSIHDTGVRSALCVPMLYEQEVLGVLHVDTIGAANAFDRRDIEVLTTIGLQAALAVKNAVLRERVRVQEAEAAHAARLALVGQLAGGLAHDFNNILNVVGLTLDSLEGDPSALPVARELAVMRGAVDRASQLTKQLLAFSRREAVQPAEIELEKVVENMRSILERACKPKCRLTTQIGWDIPRVFADPGQIEQILMNLAVNARDASAEGGRIRVKLSGLVVDGENPHRGLQHGGYARIEVTDYGTGMTPEVARRVFEPFFTTKPKGEGTGLGLSTVLGIVEAAGGHVFVDTEVGKGTTFEVVLPERSASAQHDCAA